MKTKKRRLVCGLLVAAVVLGLAVPVARATTWGSKKVTCPLCGTVNIFQVVGSYGSYIYSWPSKFQYIFWPRTDKRVIYSCRKCRLSCFMWDFEGLPQEKHAAVRQQLAGVKFDQEYAEYSEIPMAQRLRAAEKVYAALDRDEEFWCDFYRVLAYHLEQDMNALPEGKEKATLQREVDAARRKALAQVERLLPLLASRGQTGRRKEFLLIRGAMKRFLRDDPGALADFKQAAGLTYTNPKMPAEDAQGLDEYLSKLLQEYRELIEKQPSPASPKTGVAEKPKASGDAKKPAASAGAEKPPVGDGTSLWLTAVLVATGVLAVALAATLIVHRRRRA